MDADLQDQIFRLLSLNTVLQVGAYKDAAQIVCGWKNVQNSEVFLNSLVSVAG